MINMGNNLQANQTNNFTNLQNNQNVLQKEINTNTKNIKVSHDSLGWKVLTDKCKTAYTNAINALPDGGVKIFLSTNLEFSFNRGTFNGGWVSNDGSKIIVTNAYNYGLYVIDVDVDNTGNDSVTCIITYNNDPAQKPADYDIVYWPDDCTVVNNKVYVTSLFQTHVDSSGSPGEMWPFPEATGSGDCVVYNLDTKICNTLLTTNQWINPINAIGNTVVYGTAFGVNFFGADPIPSNFHVFNAENDTLVNTFELKYNNKNAYMNSFALLKLTVEQLEYLKLPQSLIGKTVMYGSIGEGGYSNNFTATYAPVPSSYSYRAIVDIETGDVYKLGYSNYLLASKVYKNKIYSLDNLGNIYVDSLLTERYLLVNATTEGNKYVGSNVTPVSLNPLQVVSNIALDPMSFDGQAIDNISISDDGTLNALGKYSIYRISLVD
jgi:hypothetical protein